MSSRNPNIVLILADDLGQGDVSCFNPQAGWRTESIDRLAAGGMRFTDSHATSALCTPSRYSLMTGRYNWRSPLKSSVLPGDSQALVEKERLTLPRFLQQLGYRTSVVGKWHLGLDWQLSDGDHQEEFGIDPDSHPVPEGRMGRDGSFDPAFQYEIEGTDIDFSKPIEFGPREMGFDYSFITAASLDQPPYVYIENGLAQGVPSVWMGDDLVLDRRTDSQQQLIQAGPAVEGYDVQNVAGDFQAKVLEQIDELAKDPDTPFFLYVPSHLVHGPIIPDAQWQGRSGLGPYGDWVLQFDSYVGQILDALDEKGIAEDTLVLLTSDNGASGVAGLPHLRELGHDPSNGWRGHKTDIWEGGHREPTIVRWPGHVQAGAVSERTVSHSDIFRTVADLLGHEVPEEAAEDSVSNLPLWMGRDQDVRSDLVSHSGGGGFAIRQGVWKLELVTDGDGMDAAYEAQHGGVPTEYRPAQLYDLSRDPAEADNVISQHPQKVQELMALLAEHIRRGRSTPGPDRSNAPNRPTGTWPQVSWMGEEEA